MEHQKNTIMNGSKLAVVKPQKIVAEKAIQEQVTPLAKNVPLMRLVEALLKSPEKLLATIKAGDYYMIAVKFIGVLSLGFLLYGVVTGSFSMGTQLWIAPLKIWLGILFTALICFPSFYIFICLTQADISLKQAFAIMCAGLTLISILLIGFMPVALVFSTSTESVAFMGLFHLVFWFISVGFGMRFIIKSLEQSNAKWTFFIKLWMIIFLITSLQMMTAIRPIIGKSDRLLPEKKMFFIENWLNSMNIRR